MAHDMHCYESSAALAADVAHRLLSVISALQAEGRDPHVALTGGTIAREIYAAVAERASASAVDWTRVHFWWGDERFVAGDSPDRNARQARDALLDVVGATLVHEMPTPGSACSVDEGARSYEAQVRASGGGQFDLVLLSLGPDGHVASLFPGSPQLNATDRIAVGVTGSPKPPPERITLTFEALNRSARMWIFATDTGAGGQKEDSFNRAMADDPAIPATRVHGEAETIWFVS